MLYGNMRWTEIENLDKEQVVVVCPLASMEQHGHHLPLLTDTCLVSELAERIHERLEDQIALTPTLWLGASDHHLDFPGTLSVPITLYTEMIKNLLRSFVKAGFRRIFFLNGHGGNLGPGSDAIYEMANSCDECDSALVSIGSYWNIAQPAMAAEKHGMGSRQLSHSCEYETSMMLHLHRELVVMECAKGTEPVIESRFYSSENLGRVGVSGRFRRQSETGAMGRPDLATAEKGKSLLEAITDEVAAFIRDFSAWQHLPVLK